MWDWQVWRDNPDADLAARMRAICWWRVWVCEAGDGGTADRTSCGWLKGPRCFMAAAMVRPPRRPSAKEATKTYTKKARSSARVAGVSEAVSLRLPTALSSATDAASFMTPSPRTME